MPLPRHTDKAVRGLLAEMIGTYGWSLRPGGGHAHVFGVMSCGSGCWVPVRSTPKGDNQATILARKFANCPHGKERPRRGRRG